jgi:hypothetical protein
MLMKRTALAPTIMVALLLVAVASLFLRLASANPVPWPSTPNQEKPTLTVETPKNNTAYDASSVYLNFTVTEPDSWNKVHMVIPYIGQIASVNVYLDGKSIQFGGYGYGNFESFSVKLNQSASGVHMLNVTVLSFTYYRGPPYNNSHIVSDIISSSGPVYEYPIVVSYIVYFTVFEEPSPSPQETESFPTAYSMGIAGVIVLMLLGSMVYILKPKH